MHAPKSSHGAQSWSNDVRPDHTKCAFTLPAKATQLNRHGAAIQLNRELLIGSTVVLQNTRHIQLSARVVTQVSAQRQGIYTYGVEFLEPTLRKRISGESLFRHPRGSEVRMGEAGSSSDLGECTAFTRIALGIKTLSLMGITQRERVEGSTFPRECYRLFSS